MSRDQESPPEDLSTRPKGQVDTEEPEPTDKGGSPKRLGDVIFSGASLGSGILILATLAGVATFLMIEAAPVLGASPDEITGDNGFFAYVWPLVIGTLVASVIALAMATPIAVGIALFVSHYANPRVGNAIGFVIDLLAAVPSVVFGMWGLQVFAPAVVPLYDWLEARLGLIPLFGDASNTGRTLLTASLVLAVMILPIITSVSREVFLQTPRLHEEAALALGATKWEMITTAVLPFGKPGVIGGTMLGLGRALGETMAVTIILSPGVLRWNLIGTGNATIPSEIALNFPEASGLRLSELIAAGLVLFVITLAVNLFARYIVEKRAEFSGAN
ncbi:phosphate ABC transporter permease subunit PstC [soil metagenome]